MDSGSKIQSIACVYADHSHVYLPMKCQVSWGTWLLNFPTESSNSAAVKFTKPISQAMGYLAGGDFKILLKILFFLLAALRAMWGPSSLTRDQTQVPALQGGFWTAEPPEKSLRDELYSWEMVSEFTLPLFPQVFNNINVNRCPCYLASLLWGSHSFLK